MEPPDPFPLQWAFHHMPTCTEVAWIFGKDISEMICDYIVMAGNAPSCTLENREKKLVHHGNIGQNITLTH